MFFSLGFALLGLFFRLIFEVEAATCKYNEWTVESDAGLDSITNIGGIVWEHRNGEERNSISQELLTVAVTIILAVLLHQCMWFFSQVTIVLGDDYGGMFEGQSSQSENSCDPIIEIRVEVKT
ncbi:PREDICTED: uncharacterized protein LOC107340073 isoform X3 [Acropora digitifera]|uniref:uncharacterized protein LOC107340073 isoform X3 n=1 Tax=Acropora digitifera TaxID=70779 RepID=UPI00077A54FB|nr:PREDICTED: uncharacterized protein LOC107340073 isoform X3 [Acropora digitifera]XP_015760904.1 PREDICTED: uncharacterized protein LOC107340073 isoform X3 [Acropora digitifera]